MHTEQTRPISQLEAELNAERALSRTTKAYGFIQAALRLTSDARRLMDQCSKEEYDAFDKAMMNLLKAKAYASRRMRGL